MSSRIETTGGVFLNYIRRYMNCNISCSLFIATGGYGMVKNVPSRLRNRFYRFSLNRRSRSVCHLRKSVLRFFDGKLPVVFHFQPILGLTCNRAKSFKGKLRTYTYVWFTIIVGSQSITRSPVQWGAISRQIVVLDIPKNKFGDNTIYLVLFVFRRSVPFSFQLPYLFIYDLHWKFFHTKIMY